jgi:hypothetical protein
VDRTSRRPARIEIAQAGTAIEVVIHSELGGRLFTRSITCDRDDPLLEVHVAGFAARRLSVTCRFEMVEKRVSMEMDTIGGTITRPRERVHQPTFWPVPSLLTLQADSGAVHVGFEAPTAVSFSPSHALEWIVARNPTRERAFGVLPVLAHPFGGTVDELQTHRAILFATRGRGVSSELRGRLERAWLPLAQRRLKDYATSLVRCDDAAVSFAAVKRADAGVGVIVRLARDLGAPRSVRVWVPSQTIWGAFLCDAREKNLGPLEVVGGRVIVPLKSRLTTVRVVAR